MTDWSDLLRIAIFDTLSGDGTLRTNLGATVALPRIFSDVPSKQVYPYIVIGGEDEVRWATHDKSGAEVLVPVVVHTREASWVKSGQLRGDVLRLLGDVDLTIAGFDVVGGYFDGASKSMDKSENSKQQILEIRYNILES